MDNKIIQKCSSPVRILDRVKGGYMYVPCGRCDSCQANYKSLWQQRLELEAQSSVTTLFFTLTYDNNNIPALTYLVDSMVSNRSEFDNIDFSDYCFDSELANINVQSLPLIQNDKSDLHRVGYCCKKDIQKFIKRLRRLIDYDTQNLLSHVQKNDRHFRYFIASEYGPNTFRPHYHGLLFFSNKHVAESVKQYYFFKSWSLCDRQNMDISTVVCNAASYVSKYVRCYTKLPAILKIPAKTAPFFLSSRKPAIGVNYFNYSSLVSKVECHSAHVDKLSFTKNSVSSYQMPILRTTSSYYFPKVYCSHSYDTRQLFSFYSHAHKYCSPEVRAIVKTFNTFADARSYLSSLIPNYIKFVNSYLQHLNYKHSDISKLSDIYNNLNENEIRYGISQNRQCILKYLYFSYKYDVTLFDYIRNYQSFYTVKNSETMSYMYDCYNDMINQGFSKLDVFRFVYPSFVDSLPHCCYSMSTDQYINYEMVISSFGLSHSDIYNKNGFMHIQFNYTNSDYINTSIYVQHSNHVIDKNIKFEKTRFKNHLLNQKLNNYERF